MAGLQLSVGEGLCCACWPDLCSIFTLLVSPFPLVSACVRCLSRAGFQCSLLLWREYLCLVLDSENLGFVAWCLLFLYGFKHSPLFPDSSEMPITYVNWRSFVTLGWILLFPLYFYSFLVLIISFSISLSSLIPCPAVSSLLRSPLTEGFFCCCCFVLI